MYGEGFLRFVANSREKCYIKSMKPILVTVILASSLATFASTAQVLRLPQRPPSALTGSAFAALVSQIPREEREDQIFGQITSGNVPLFLRRLVPVTVKTADAQHTLTYYVTPDYLAIGSDTDYLLVPMTPILAQRIADTTGCSLPTKKMVDDIYSASPLRLTPQPIPPSAEMITVHVFAMHNDSVWQQRSAVIQHFPLGTLVSGHKKDVIVSNYIRAHLRPAVPRPVVIYGWHQPDGTPIQPVYNGHAESYADYSHGIRLVQTAMILDGTPAEMDSLLNDPVLCGNLSDEGRIAVPRYGHRNGD
jgi:hypothetical protein